MGKVPKGSIIIVSDATEHGPPHHDGSHLGDSTAWKKNQNRIIPVGVQTPDHVLSAPDLACLSADDNIFDIMNQAQEKCNGTDIRCTFYHFMNHSYDNIGTVDINKERFDDLLLKFDNWLLTDEHIETNGGKIKEDHVLEPTYTGLNEHSSIPSDLKGVDVSQSKHIDVLDHRSNESGDDRANSHHIKPPHETHHKNHNKDHNSDAAQHFKKHWKDSNHIVIQPEYNSEHKYFEVFIPKDKFTGKPRTIYVEVDQHKNEFVLLDEGIDKKFKGVKPIRIELDELSDIADTAFNELTKSSNFKEHVHHHLNDDEKAVISDISSGVHEHKIHLDADVSEHIMHDTINPDVHHPNINAIDANQVLIADVKTGKEKKVLNVIKSQIVPNKYINQAQFQVETHLDNTTDHNIINDHLLKTSNDTDNNQVTFHEEEFPLNSIEYSENSIDLNSEKRHDMNIEKSSPEHSDIPNENNNNTTEYHDLSINQENVSYNDDHLIELEENNNTYHDTDSDDTRVISAPNAFDLNEPTSHIEKHTSKQFIINIKPELNPSVATGISDYSGSPFHAIPSENRRQGDILNLPLEPPSNISPEPRTIYAIVPILGEESAKVLKTDSPIPGYGSVDLFSSDSQITPQKSFDGHPTVYSYNFPIDSIPTPSVTSKISHLSSPIPSAECAVKLNTESKSSPSNFGFSWMPPKIAELHLPCVSNGLSPNCGSPPNTVSSLSVPSMEFSGSSQSPSDRTTLFKDSSITYNAPSINFDIQKPSLTTRPCESESATPMPPEYFLLTKLGLPTPNTDFDGMSLSTPLSSMPCGFKDAVTSPNHKQQIPSYLKQSIPYPIDSGFNKMSPFDKNSKDTIILCPPYLQQNIPYPIDLGFNKMSPFEKNLKDTMIPGPPCSNRYPYFSNPYIRPPQFVPSYIAPFQPANSFPLVSKILTPDSSSMSLYNSPPCQSDDYLKETKPMPFLPYSPNTPFSPLNPLTIGPNFPPCPNVWNKVPYLPCTDRNIRNYAPFVSNYLTPTIDQTYKPLHLKDVPLPMPEQPCLANNLLITPSSYTPCLLVQTSPLNPSLALEKDLESLSLKYGISLPNMLSYLQKDKSDSNTCPLTLKIPHSNLKLDLQLNTNANFDDNCKNGDLLTLDSTLTGPDLKIGNKLMLDANQFQEHTITTENIAPSTTKYCQIKNKPDYLHDSSLIGPHILSPSSNIVFNNENLNVNEVDVSELKSSNSIYLDSSLTGPSINMGRPQVLQGTTVFQGETVGSQTEVPIAISSEMSPKLNQNQPSKSLLDTSLIGSHLPSLSPVKPFLSNEIKSLSEIGSLNSELTDLTPRDIPPVYFGNVFEKPENVQHEKCYLDYPPTEYLATQLVERELLLKDASNFKTLDSSLIGPELKTGNLPVIEDDVQHKNIPVVPQFDLHNTETKHEENIVVPSLCAQIPNKPINADLNLNITTPGTELNENQPVTQISLKETELKIVEPAPKIHNNKIVFQESDVSLVDAEIAHESSLIGKSLFPNAEKPIVSAIFDPSIHLDNSLLGPSIQNEIDSQHISTTEQKTPIEAKTINHDIRPASKCIDTKYHLDSSLTGPSLNQGMESQETSIAYESATPLDSSLVPPSLYELERGTSTVANVKSQLDSSFTMPSLYSYNTVESSASTAASSVLDSSLTGPSLKPAVDSSDMLHVFDANKIYDSSLMGPHLITMPDSNEKSHTQSDLDTVKLLDSSLTGPHLNFGKQYDQSDIFRYQNPESFTTADVVPGILETTNFLNYDLNEDSSKPLVHSSDLQEKLSKFKNSITNSQLSGSECKPCGKLLPSIAKQSSIIPNTLPTCSDLQPLNFNTHQTPFSLQNYAVSEYYPNTMSYPQKGFSPVQPLVKAPYLETNNYPISQMSSELLPYAQGVPPIFPYSQFGQNIGVPQTLGILPYPPFVQMKPPIDRNWVSPQFLNIQNPYQGSSGFRPRNLSPEELTLSSDLTSQYQTYPQLTIANMYSPEFDMIPSSEWTRANALPLDKYMSSLPKNILIPSNSESTICDPDNSPKAVDIMSLLDENSYKLLQDMAILPLSQSSLTPNTISNTVIPSSSYMNPQTDLYNPQNVPCQIPTQKYPPNSLQPNSYVPSESEFSEIVGQKPNTMPLPSESLKPYAQSQSNENPHTPELIESIPYPREFIQQQLPKSCLDTPSFSLDTVLQSSTKKLPWHSSPPVSFITTNPSSDAITKPILPSHTSPLLVYTKPISASTSSLPLNISPSTPSCTTTLSPPTNSYSDGVLPYTTDTLTPQAVSPGTATSVLPGFSSPLRPIKTMPLSDYACPPTSVNTKPISSTSSPMYASRYSPVLSHPVPLNNSPYSSAYTSKLLPAKTSPKSTPFYEPLSAPCSSAAKPMSVAKVDSRPYCGSTTPISPVVSMPAGGLSPSKIIADTSTYNYSPTPAPINTLTNPSSALSSVSISPVSPMRPAYNRPLPSNPTFNLKPAKTTQNLENQQLLPNTPISHASNPFLNANQIVSALNRPIQNQQVPKLSPLSSSQVKQYQPSEDILRSNFHIIEGTPSGAVEENMYIYSNDKGDKFYEEPNVKFPLESLSYTLPPEEIKETLPNDNFINPEIAPLTNSASEPSLHSQPYERPLPIPLYKKPSLPSQKLLPSSCRGNVPQNINSNIPVVPPSSPFKRPVSRPTSILSSSLLKPLAPFTPATNLPLLSAPCKDTSVSPYNILTDNSPLFSSPYTSVSAQNMLPSPFDPRRIKNTISSNLTLDFSQFSPSESFASPVSSPKSNGPYNLDLLPLTKGQGSLVKPATVQNYNQYSARIPLFQRPISSPYISSMTTARNLINPFVSPQIISSTLPVQTTLQDDLPFYESPINYQPLISVPTGLISSANNIFKKPLSNTVLPSVKLIEPLSTDRDPSLSISFAQQKYLPVSSLPISSRSCLISAPRLPYSTISPEILKQALSNPIIPSSLLVASKANLQKPLKISSPFNNIPRYNYPSPALTEPLQTASCKMANKLLGSSLLPQNILKPITQYKKEKYTTTLPSLPYQTKSFESAYQPVSNVQYTIKPLPKLSPILSQYASPSLSPIYTPLPPQTILIPQINKPRTPKYSLPSSSLCNVPSYSSLLNRNPCLNPMPDVLSYPVSNNQKSSVKITPFERNLLPNLRSLDTLKSYSPPITISNPLFTSSFLKPSSHMLSPNPSLYQSQNTPINSQCITYPSAPQLLPCTNPLLKNPLLKPLLNNFQNYSPSVPMPPSNINTALPESSTTISPATDNQVWFSPKLSISELAKTYGPVNPPTTPYDFSKLPTFKQSHSPISMPSNSNYDLQGPSLNQPVNANYLNTVEPTEVSAASSSESSGLPFETEPVEEIRPCELTFNNVKNTLSKLPMNFNQQLYPGLLPKYLSLPQSTYFLPSSFKSLTPKPYISLPSVIPKDVELIDSTDFSPISSVQSESFLTDYSAFAKKAPICNTQSNYPDLNTLPSSANTVLSNIDSPSPTFKQILPEPLKNIPKMTSELDLSQFFPYSSPNTKIPSSNNQLPLIHKQQCYNNQRPQESQVYQTPKEYKQLKDLSPFQMAYAYAEPQLTSPLTRGPISEMPLYTEPTSYNPENNLQLPIFSKSLPHKETAVEINPEIENIQTPLNKYIYFNEIAPRGRNNYIYEPKSSAVEVPPKLIYGNSCFKPKEAYTEYIEDPKFNAKNNYITESNSKSLDENKPYNLEAKASYSLPDATQEFNVPDDYINNNAKRPQRLTNLDHFYENNNIGKSPQVFNEPGYNTLPKDSTINVIQPYTTKYPKILKDLTNIPTKYFGSRSKLDDFSLKPEYYPDMAKNSPKCYSQNYLNTYAQMKLPSNTMENTKIAEIPPTSFTPNTDIQDIKYSGYKTYQMPSLKSPKTLQNLVMPAQMYNPSFIPNALLNPTAKSMNQYQNPNAPRRTEISDPVLQPKLGLDTTQESPKFNEYETAEDELAAIISQYQSQVENKVPVQTNLELNTLDESPKLTIEKETIPVISQQRTPETLTSPLYSKLGFDAFEVSPNFNEYDTPKDESVDKNNIKENNDLKTSLINYLTKTDEIKNKLDNNNKELNIPLGNIAIIKKEPHEEDTIKTNNPSIGIKMWKSNAKIVQAELNLKFKELSVTNFMPVVDNLDKYDMDEIRKIVKNYIDEKYGKHIEIKEPFTVDNQYTVLEEFDHNAVSNKYNLLWPTKYV